jgi:hypothetical protein
MKRRIVGALVAVLALSLSTSGVRAAPEAVSAETIVKSMIDDPTVGGMFKAFKADFPDEFQSLVSHVTEILKTGTMDDAIKFASGYLREKTISHMTDLASAPTPELLGVLVGQRDFIVELQKENVAYCAGFGMSGLPADANLSPRALVMVNNIATLQLNAARAGIDHPTERAAMTAADVQALKDSMHAAGASDALVQETLSSPGLRTASVQEQCDGSVALYRGLAAMPPQSGAIVYSVILGAAQKQLRKQP